MVTGDQCVQVPLVVFSLPGAPPRSPSVPSIKHQSHAALSKAVQLCSFICPVRLAPFPTASPLASQPSPRGSSSRHRTPITPLPLVHPLDFSNDSLLRRLPDSFWNIHTAAQALVSASTV